MSKTAPTAPTAPKAPTAPTGAPKPTAPQASASETTGETATAATTETTTAKASFKLDTGLSIPARRAPTGGNTGSNYPFKEMPVGSSFLVEATVPQNTKAEERDAVFKDEQKRVANRMSGAIRRFKKANEGFDFAMRQVNDDELGHGVRVWRVEAGEGDAA